MSLKALPDHRVEDIELQIFLEALRLRYGYDFTGYAMASMKRRLRKLRDDYNCQHLAELLPLVLYDESTAQSVVNSITVPATEFFRDPETWLQLREQVLPRLASYARITIWQAGCSRGEETYSLLILLAEAGLLKRTRLVASDINATALDQARDASWPAETIAAAETSYCRAGGRADFASYFVEHGVRRQIRPELRCLPEFIHHNLVADDVFLETQLVVCRNVMLYFSAPLQEKVARLFFRSLQGGGFLVLGRSESLRSETRAGAGFEEFDAANRIYRRPILEPSHE